VYEFLEYQAKHVMTIGPKTIEPSASLAHAEALPRTAGGEHS
jgi:hypothetical protein